MSTFDASAHPRERAGRFTTKSRSEAEVSLGATVQNLPADEVAAGDTLDLGSFTATITSVQERMGVIYEYGYVDDTGVPRVETYEVDGVVPVITAGNPDRCTSCGSWNPHVPDPTTSCRRCELSVALERTRTESRRPARR
jgi:hypothetical protein